MNRQPIGVFDSGLGGLTTVKQLHRLMPNEDIIYFGDTGRVPYGSRSRSLLRKYTAQDMHFLMQHNVKMVIAACGTVSSTSSDLGDRLPVPFTGIIPPAARAAVQATRNGRIGVIATAATVASGAFPEKIRQLNPDLAVMQQPCPLFVPLVEGGFTAPDDPITVAVAHRYLDSLRETGVDTLILACTHYPIIAPIIRQVMGSSVTLIDSGAETARWATETLNARDLRTDGTAGTTSYYVTDRVQSFEQVGGLFLGEELTGDVYHVDVDAL